MKTIKIIAMLVSLTFLMSSCYTQLALVQHEPVNKAYSDNNGQYYYPPSQSDTLYEDESPEIVQNFYSAPPYYDPYDISLNFGFYNDWWWDDFYSPGFYLGFRPLRPFLLYPVPYWLYDSYYWNYYDPYYNYGWGWYPGSVYGTHYGPRPFAKGGSLVRGGGSRRVRISHSGHTGIGSGSSTFLPTRASGSSISGKDHSMVIRKRSSRTNVIENTTTARRISGQSTNQGNKKNRVIIKRRGNSSRTVIYKGRSTVRGRHYFPITTGRSYKRQTVVKKTIPRNQPHLKTRSYRSPRYRNSGTYESHRWTPPSRSSVSSGSSHPTYSRPSHSTSVRSAPVRSSSSSRSSGSRRAVRRK